MNLIKLVVLYGNLSPSPHIEIYEIKYEPRLIIRGHH